MKLHCDINVVIESIMDLSISRAMAALGACLYTKESEAQV